VSSLGFDISGFDIVADIVAAFWPQFIKRDLASKSK
jgi:hypothetical protein